jgi:hypothetical protein
VMVVNVTQRATPDTGLGKRATPKFKRTNHFGKGAYTEGELRVEQDGKTFTAKKDFVWTCNKDTKEQSFNDGRVVAIMRITDLKA